MGLEALSRGATHCTFVEQDQNALKALEKNIQTLGANSDVRTGSVLHLGTARKPYDLVLMDPPYGTGAGAVAMDKLGRHGWFAPSCWIAIETSRDEEISVKGFEMESRRNSGKAMLHILKPTQ